MHGILLKISSIFYINYKNQLSIHLHFYKKTNSITLIFYYDEKQIKKLLKYCFMIIEDYFGKINYLKSKQGVYSLIILI